MRLVDILARELKVWPEYALAITQDQDGETWPSSDLDVTCSGGIWTSNGSFMIGGNILPGKTSASDYSTSIVTRTQWQAAVDALKAEVHPTESMALRHQEVGRITRQWNGEGLPPVDLPCQWYSDSQTGWQEVVVLAYSGESAWIQPKGKPSIIVGNPANFLPIRTPEQIAAEVRSKACDAIYGVLTGATVERKGNTSDMAEALYDAGYRKFEIVDN